LCAAGAWQDEGHGRTAVPVRQAAARHARHGRSRFERSVTALCIHDENGAVGIGISHKRAGIRLRGLLKQLDLDPGEAPDEAVHHGGPVEPGRGFVLHSDDWGGEDTLQVVGPTGKLWSMTGTVDVLRAISEGRGPSRWLVALGYAGWGPGQLEEEMTRHGWFACDGQAGILFDTPTQGIDERWQTGLWLKEHSDNQPSSPGHRPAYLLGLAAATLSETRRRRLRPERYRFAHPPSERRVQRSRDVGQRR
jgi:putative transcriptional regulator